LQYIVGATYDYSVSNFYVKNVDKKFIYKIKKFYNAHGLT